MKTHQLILALAIGLCSACEDKDFAVPASPVVNSISALSDFRQKNEVKSEFFTFNANTGGSFTSVKGSKISIQPNAFKDELNQMVSGLVKVEFKDIFTKSDMILSDMPTEKIYGGILKSSGEFFIRATKGNTALVLDQNKPILVELPLNNKPADPDMKPFEGVINDTMGMNGWQWRPSAVDMLSFNAQSYLYSLYRFSSTASAGTWCNSDNQKYFSAYPQTSVTITPTDDPDIYGTEVYLAFKGVNALVHVYRDPGAKTYSYWYAPSGQPCTLVGLGSKDGKLYYAMQDITISKNFKTGFTLSEISSDELKTKLSLLND